MGSLNEILSISYGGDVLYPVQSNSAMALDDMYTVSPTSTNVHGRDGSKRLSIPSPH